jgi:hypothetical protein
MSRTKLKTKQTFCKQHTFAASSGFRDNLTKQFFYVASSHKLRTVGLILIRFYAHHTCASPPDSLACFTLFIRENQKHSQIENLEGMTAKAPELLHDVQISELVKLTPR